MGELSCIVQAYMPEPVLLSAPEKWRLPELFIAQSQAVTMSPEA
jgi:hypothetical protein